MLPLRGEDLASFLLEGGDAAWEALWSHALHHARRHVRHADDAQDVSQKVCVKVYELACEPEGLAGIRNARAFVATMARNAARDYSISQARLRKEADAGETGESGPRLLQFRAPEGGVPLSEARRADALRRAIASLEKSRDRDAIELYLQMCAGLIADYKDIAQALFGDRRKNKRASEVVQRACERLSKCDGLREWA